LDWRITGSYLSDLAVALVLRYSIDEDGSPWTFVLYVDERGDAGQRRTLEDIFTGRLGGDALLHFPWAWKASNVVGVRPAQIEFDHTTRRQLLRIGEEVLVRIRAAFDGDQAITCVIPGHDRPGGELVTERLQVALEPPLDFDYRGTCGYAATFGYRGS
jgi:hypothetical protein